MPTLLTRLEIPLPECFDAVQPDLPEVVVDLDGRVALVLDMARRNVEGFTGGPFAAGVFERDSGRLVSLGTNRVLPTHCSAAHAEVLALALAQLAVGSYDLGAGSLPAHQLVASWQPCAMCFGAVLWSGVVDLVIAGVGPEVEELTGFDEGPIHPDWRAELARRSITLTEGIRRDEAVAVLAAYAVSGAPPYHARGGD